MYSKLHNKLLVEKQLWKDIVTLSVNTMHPAVLWKFIMVLILGGPIPRYLISPF